MAKYNREFLVPYLRDICALHMAQRKIERKMEEISWAAHQANQGKYAPHPSEPSLEREFTFGRILSILLGAGIMFICASVIPTAILRGIGLCMVVLLCVGTGALMVWGAVSLIRDAKRNNNDKWKTYYAEMDTYHKVRSANEEAKKQIPALRSEYQKYDKESDKVAGLLRKMYSANVIPGHYRNIYAAVYLYDWFSSAQEDDLAMALNMFVLEEIKEKLDRIIARQSEMIINQCMMLANQQQSMIQRERHAEMMRTKLNQIAQSNEERNIYLSMIEGNTAATAYFAAAEYIRRI